MPRIIASTYEILQELGSGGAGIVYLGNHLRLNKKIALKADQRKLSDKTEELLRREVDALKSLSHTNIPHVYDFVIENETVYTVMDYIDGESLDIPLKNGERFSQPQVIKWARELLEAVSYLHSPHSQHPYGILHSDIKPANIMLKPQGNICLIDFNIALALGEEGAVAVGRSFGYASPEHYGINYSPSSNTKRRKETTLLLDSGDKGASTLTMPKNGPASGSSSSNGKSIILDVRSDIYGLGATLYHLLTGRRPSTDAMKVLPLSDKEFSPRIAAIINKAMNPVPDLRYQTAEEMLFDLNHLHENDPRTKRHKRTRYVTGLSLAVLFLLGVFTSFAGLKQMERIQSIYALAEYSAGALSEGNVPLAVNLALEALPEKNNIFVPPYTPQAKKALTDALGIYDLSDRYKPFQTLTLPSPPLNLALSRDGKTAAAVYAYEIAVFDTDTAEITAKLPAVSSALAEVEFINDTLLVYAGENGICAYDTAKRQELWTGWLTTGITVSADGSTIAAVYKDESRALIYNADGTEKAVISFDNKKQLITENDTFANPNDNLFALNKDGGLLAVSFADGSLKVFDLIDDKNTIEIYDSSEFVHFEGGFSDIYFAFSASNSDLSIFAVVDMLEIEQLGVFESDRRFGVLADESGIYISSDNIVVKLDPADGQQQEVAYTGSDVIGFALSSQYAVVATKDNGFSFFDGNANQLVKYSGNYSCNFVCIEEDFAITGGRDTPVIKILKYEDHSDAQSFAYDAEYSHDEARINEDTTRIMLFSYESLWLYDINGTLLCETSIPNAEKVYDQQYSKKSGNLAVIYKDALRIYSGDDGGLLFERTDLKSAFYAPYGVSVLEQNGILSLIDIDKAESVAEFPVQGEFAAFCGMVVDQDFLSGREIIGAGENSGSYFFAVSDGISGAVYDDKGKKLFEIAATGQCTAFFTDNAITVSPLHGTPTVYSIKTGKKIRELEKDAYLTYLTQIGGYIVSEYITADGERFALLLEEPSMQTVAYLPHLTDINGDKLLFDYRTGILRESRVYSIDELKNIAVGGGF